MQHKAEIIDAVMRGDTSVVAQLLDRLPELVSVSDEHGKTALHWAAESDEAEMARILLDAGADLEARTAWGATALEWAATMGSTRVGELLISRGAGGLTLVVAAGLGKLAEVRERIESGTDLLGDRRRGAPKSADNYWPADSAHILGDVISDAMYAAARNGHADVVEYLLDKGADVDAKGFFGATALHWAAIHGHRSTIDLLVARGAGLAVRDARFNSTPSEWAAEGGHTDIAEALRLDIGTA